jgi:hypothetical protein
MVTITLPDGQEVTSPLAYVPMAHHKLGLTYTASGYGRKIPSPYKVMIGKRFHRLYTCIFSNIGTCYVIIGGVPCYVSDITTYVS